MRLLRRQLLGSLVLGAAPAVARGATAPADQSPPTRTGLKTRFKNSTADWDVLFQRRFVRMIVPYSRTLFFRDKAVVYGTAANGGELLEKWINTTFKTGARPVTVELSPVSRDRLIPALLAGEGDIAAGDITITPERAKLVAFTTPVLRNVREVIVTSDDVPDIQSRGAIGHDGDGAQRVQLRGKPYGVEPAPDDGRESTSQDRRRAIGPGDRGSDGNGGEQSCARRGR